VACECGCGYEGEDELVQYLLEEALMTALELDQARTNAETTAAAPAEQAIAKTLARRQRVLQELGEGS
jgi:hypothetical protein